MTPHTESRSPENDRSNALAASELEGHEAGISASLHDLRTETVQQHQLNTSLQNGPEMQKRAALGDMINASPKMAAQAKFVSGLQAPVVQRAMKTYKDIQDSAGKNRFNWKKMRTRLDDVDEEEDASAKGYGVKTTENTNLKTKIDWKAVHGEAGEGTEMDAKVLGPDHKLGSEPQSGKTKVWNKRRNKLSKDAGGAKYIAGHLLNNNLGGPGDDPRNLTAIPATANTKQSANIEEEVKDLVNKKHLFVHYKVKISYAKDTEKKKHYYASKIDSWWNTLDKDGADLPPVRNATIDIPAPSDIDDGDEIEYEETNDAVDSNHGAKAVIDDKNDVILNNTGYLGVAVTVQKSFEASINKLQNSIKEAMNSKIESELERGEVLEDVVELQDQLDSYKEQLEELKKELGDKSQALLEMTELTETMKQENETLIQNIVELKVAASQSAQRISELENQLKMSQTELQKMTFENEKMKKKIKKKDKKLKEKKEIIKDQNKTIGNLELQNMGLSVSHAASQDLMNLPNNEVPMEDNKQIYDTLRNVNSMLARVQNLSSNLDMQYQAFLQRMNQQNIQNPNNTNVSNSSSNNDEQKNPNDPEG